MSNTKIDLVYVLLNEYRDRVQPSVPAEVQDIADAHGVTAQAVCDAMLVALDELEGDDRCNACGLLNILHGIEGECPVPAENTDSEIKSA